MSLIPSRKSIFNPPQWPDEDQLKILHQEMIQKGALVGVGEGAQQEGPPAYISIRVEAIENGFIVSYSATGVRERRRFAPNLTGLGEQIVTAAVEVKLRGTEGQ